MNTTGIKRWLFMALMAMVGAAAAGRAADVRVELGDGLNGAWLQPAVDWDGRVVILCHGFASDMNGPANSSKRLAEALASAGIATFRINYRGEGDDARTQIESTYGSRVADTESTYAWVLKQPGVNARRIGILGWSLGGGTAIETAAAHPAWFKSMVLWSSVSGDLYQNMTQDYMRDAAAQAERDGVGTRVIAGWKTVTLRREFFESYRGVNLDRSLAKFPGAFLSIRGSADYLPMSEATWLKAITGQPAEAVLIGGADHIFNVFDPASGHLQRATEVTVGWMQRTL